MERVFTTKGLTAAELQAHVDSVWTIVLAEPELRRRIDEMGYDLSQNGEADPFEVRRPREAFTAVELVLIAAAGRVVGGLAEKSLERLWDEILWPRLRPLVGRQLKPGKDADE